jgi:hypothetical protein
MLDSGSPRRTMVLRHPQIRVYQPDRASRTACRTATHPADHNPTRYQTQMREILVPHLTNLTPYQHRMPEIGEQQVDRGSGYSALLFERHGHPWPVVTAGCAESSSFAESSAWRQSGSARRSLTRRLRARLCLFYGSHRGVAGWRKRSLRPLGCDRPSADETNRWRCNDLARIRGSS